MILVSYAEEWCWLLEAHECQAKPIFGSRMAETLALISKYEPIANSLGIDGHETISTASRPLNILHMGLMSDAEEWCWLLEAHGCQAIPIFANPGWLKLWHSSANLDQKSRHLWP